MITLLTRFTNHVSNTLLRVQRSCPREPEGVACTCAARVPNVRHILVYRNLVKGAAAAENALRRRTQGFTRVLYRCLATVYRAEREIEKAHRHE
jgi:hypothetical protein